jgi:4a-hydroxytetrahydrobiopterin dehydratase
MDPTLAPNIKRKNLRTLTALSQRQLRAGAPSSRGSYISPDAGKADGERAPNSDGGGFVMEALGEKSCTPCRGGVPPLTPKEAESLRGQAPDWALHDDAHRIERAFRFGNFREALKFVDEVGKLAEAEGHHPDINFGWGYAIVSLQTKKIKGLHENDFIMAAKIDRIAKPEG